VVFIPANISWKYKEFKIFQASEFSKLGIKARNPALFLQQKQKVTTLKVEKTSRNKLSIRFTHGSFIDNTWNREMNL